MFTSYGTPRYDHQKASIQGYMKAIKRIWNAVTTVLIGLMVILAALLWGFRPFGYEILIVQSGSMEPSCPVGSLVYIKPVDAAELKTGDIITFELGGGLRGTHRITAVTEENGSLAFRTKGDANDMEDSNPVAPKDIVGKVTLTIPKLGYLVTYIQNPPGTYVTICAAAFLLLLTILPDLIFPNEKSGRS